MNEYNVLLYLISCALNGCAPQKTLSQLGINSAEDCDKLFKLAEEHSLAALISFPLETISQAEDTDLARRLADKCTKRRFASIRRTKMFDAERAVIEKFLEENGIAYLPLKGIIINPMYPKIGMREFSDNDILYDSSHAKQVRDRFISRGYKCCEYGVGADDSYKKKPIYNFEMHRTIIKPSGDKTARRYYDNIFSWQPYRDDAADGVSRHVLIGGEGARLELCGDDFYVMFISHAFIHFKNGGTGLRTAADVYVLLQNLKDLDQNYVSRETRKLGAQDFERTLRSLSIKLFSDPESVGKLSGDEQKLFDSMIFSGTYGKFASKIDGKVGEYSREGETPSAAKARYALRRIFPTRETMLCSFPRLGKYTLLLPLLYIVRIVRPVFSRRRRKKIRGEISALKNKRQ